MLKDYQGRDILVDDIIAVGARVGMHGGMYLAMVIAHEDYENREFIPGPLLHPDAAVDDPRRFYRAKGAMGMVTRQKFRVRRHNGGRRDWLTEDQLAGRVIVIGGPRFAIQPVTDARGADDARGAASEADPAADVPGPRNEDAEYSFTQWQRDDEAARHMALPATFDRGW